MRSGEHNCMEQSRIAEAVTTKASKREAVKWTGSEPA
jgi:hypothetical protein